MRTTKILDWQPVPGRSPRSRDVYAVRGTDRWVVKKAQLNHAGFYVVRLNGSVVTRQETLRAATARAEQLAVEREGV